MLLPLIQKGIELMKILINFLVVFTSTYSSLALADLSAVCFNDEIGREVTLSSDEMGSYWVVNEDSADQFKCRTENEVASQLQMDYLNNLRSSYYCERPTKICGSRLSYCCTGPNRTGRCFCRKARQE